MPRRAFISLVLGVSGNVNADAGVGVRIPMKKVVTWNREIRAFVSPRCIRRAIRTRLAEKGFEIDPLSTEVGQLTDVGDPVRYADDDLFGYLSPKKGKGEVQPARSGPVKVSPLIALHHTEISVEFAGRFPRADVSDEAPDANPVPFEVETARWLGAMHVIVSEDVGRFRLDELPSDVLDRIEKGEYRGLVSSAGGAGGLEGPRSEVPKKMRKGGREDSLPSGEGLKELERGEREKRLRALLEILIKEGWSFPRGSEALSQPEYHYALIVLSESFLPMPNVLTVDSELKLDMNSLEERLKIYDWIKAYVIDYEENKVHILSKNGHEVRKIEEGPLNDIIRTITDFLLRSS
ncbi:MAG: type I-B CRISPR-associated protein Cas7/Cst2/DevR [Candidatus Korarchaeum sp.]|nr:type I-B CRISPR-associated protein Cas7/Cst2/DevR [Candidatus Korarchaeum sp.]MDW8035251.1 type I-B CRISPR-associated protein Cas7/Cst2/DevR [Candidatus Korarchaeum sp.]